MTQLGGMDYVLDAEHGGKNMWDFGKKSWEEIAKDKIRLQRLEDSYFILNIPLEKWGLVTLLELEDYQLKEYQKLEAAYPDNELGAMDTPWWDNIFNARQKLEKDLESRLQNYEILKVKVDKDGYVHADV